jgi:hypothetical protein
MHDRGTAQICGFGEKIWGREGGYISSDIDRWREFGGVIGAREGKIMPFRVLIDCEFVRSCAGVVCYCELYGTLRL